MKKVEHKKGAVWKNYNVKKVQHEKERTQKKCTINWPRSDTEVNIQVCLN